MILSVACDRHLLGVDNGLAEQHHGHRHGTAVDISRPAIAMVPIAVSKGRISQFFEGFSPSQATKSPPKMIKTVNSLKIVLQSLFMCLFTFAACTARKTYTPQISALIIVKTCSCLRQVIPTDPVILLSETGLNGVALQSHCEKFDLLTYDLALLS
jgi:hypothetical protein